MNINQSILNKTLDGLWQRQQMTSHNIANYSTPEYKSKKVDFEENLRKALESGETKKEISSNIVSSNIDINDTDDMTMRLDGNNVDIEKENLTLAETQLHYMYAVSELNSYFAKLRLAIKGQ